MPHSYSWKGVNLEILEKELLENGLSVKEENFTSQDKKLAQIVTKYYPHKRSVEEVIAYAGIIGFFASILGISYLLL